MKKIGKIGTIIVAITILLLTGCKNNLNSNKLSIISTSFPGYDFARAITKETETDIKMLIKPGTETHTYEPTPQDIINISSSDIFIYVGGDSDNWIEEVLKNIDPTKTKIIKLMDLVDTMEEKIVEGMEEEEHEKEHDEEKEIELDEHVWTSPKNAITIVNKIKEEIIKIDNNNKTKYEENTKSYIEELENIDKEITNLVNNAKRKEIIFGDRFPFLYFARDYKLSYYAAFPGCSEQTEASAKTISFLINKVKEDNIPVVFKIELSNGNIANAIGKETNAKVLEFHSGHNITVNDFETGTTLATLMKKNIENLKIALN